MCNLYAAILSSHCPIQCLPNFSIFLKIQAVLSYVYVHYWKHCYYSSYKVVQIGLLQRFCHNARGENKHKSVVNGIFRHLGIEICKIFVVNGKIRGDHGRQRLSTCMQYIHMCLCVSAMTQAIIGGKICNTYNSDIFERGKFQWRKNMKKLVVNLN